MDQSNVIAYLNAHRDRMLDELFAYLRIPSVSSKSEHRTDMRLAASFLADRMREAGLEHVDVLETGRAVIRSSMRIGYMHQDSQPQLSMDIMMFNLRSHSNCGRAHRLNPRFVMVNCSRVGRQTIKRKFTCI